MEDVQVQALEVVKKHGKAMAAELVTVVAFPALQTVVKESATPIDDVLLAALEAPLKAEILKQIEAL
ncbi:MAG TPA: hypothetical protein PLQ39_11270 [Acinetobacter sp.]|nr:hypothetical protein [Acinetobacter sp.]